MTSNELNAALETIGWSQKTLAIHAGVSRGTAFHWTTGHVPVPEAVAVYLRTIMAFLDAVPKPSGRAVSIASVRRDKPRRRSRGTRPRTKPSQPSVDQWPD